MKKDERRNSKKAGFTLVELLLVVTILGVLASIAVMNLGGTSEEARIKATQSDIATIQGAVSTYEIRTGKYPSSIDDLAKEMDGQKGLLDASALTDKWGTKYSFKNEGGGYFEIRSAGPDTAMNTADDIFNSKCKAAARQ
ncbi:MAG: type II secretion system protein GspG [Kiritimatiellae bacterium]|jgi:type II secretion system protein G|nr:type II secretion system protein GspG [Kiritimatiellia bacterium]